MRGRSGVLRRAQVQAVSQGGLKSEFERTPEGILGCDAMSGSARIVLEDAKTSL